jgi:hypothetical protein
MHAIHDLVQTATRIVPGPLLSPFEFGTAKQLTDPAIWHRSIRIGWNEISQQLPALVAHFNLLWH